jgi:meiotic recombination protein SPO11
MPFVALDRYVAELDRLVLKDKVLKRIFADASSARKTAITTRVLQIVMELCSKGIHVTKRDLFYTDVKLFKQQTESDDVLDDAACMVGCTRSSLNVVASEKGVVVGKLIFEDDGDTIDCTKMGALIRHERHPQLVLSGDVDPFVCRSWR